MSNLLEKTGIRSVNFYTARPVETCDRCGQGIRNVALVAYKDGTSARFGMDCIDKILKTAPSLRKLFNKNAKWLKKINDALDIFSRAPEDMPKGHEYYGSGLWFIGYSNPKDGLIKANGRNIWHPVIDWEKNQNGDKYYVQDGTPEEYREKRMAEMQRDIAWFQGQKVQAESFLARVLSKCSSEEAKSLIAKADK